MSLTVLDHVSRRELSYCGLMELMMEGGDARERDPETGETPLHVLYRAAVRPLEIYSTTKLLVENGCEVNAADNKGVTPVELLVLHVNRGLIHHKPRLDELKRLEDLHESQANIDREAASSDAVYQKKVLQSFAYLLEKGANCDVVPVELPFVAHDRTWSEAFEHKIMQQEGRWTLLRFGTGMIYSKYNIFNPLTKHRVHNRCALPLLHLVAWRGDAAALALVLKRIKSPTQQGSDGRSALHLLYHYCNKPRDLARCTALLLEAGLDPNLPDSEGNPPLFYLLKHTFVKRSYIRYLSNSYTVEELEISPEADSLVPQIVSCVTAMRQSACSLRLTHANAQGNTALHIVFNQFLQVLYNCDKGFQQTGHAMVPYNFSIEPASVIAALLIQHGAPVNATNVDGQTALHLLCRCLSSLSLTPSVNMECQVTRCFEVLLEGGAQPNIKDGSGKAALLYLPIYPDVIRSTAGQVVEYLEPLIVLLTDHGADLNSTDPSGHTLFHRFLILNYSWDSGGPSTWDTTSFVQGMMAHLYRRFLYLLVSRGADPSVPSRQTYVLTAIYSAHQCDCAEGETENFINLKALRPMLQILTHNMTQAAVRKAMTRSFMCPQVVLSTNPTDTSDEMAADKSNRVSHSGEPGTSASATSTNRGRSGRKSGTNSKSETLVQEDSVTEKSLILWRRSLNCDICRMLFEAVTQPRRLKHACKHVIWRTLRHRFAISYVDLPLPPALRNYVGDLTIA